MNLSQLLPLLGLFSLTHGEIVALMKLPLARKLFPGVIADFASSNPQTSLEYVQMPPNLLQFS